MNETQIGQLVIDLKIRTEALEKGLENAKKKLQSIEEENKNVKNSNKDLEGSYLALSAVAVASLMKLNNIIKESVEEYKEYTQAMSSLENVADYTGQSLDDFGSIMNKFGAYMTKADLATTIKNFSLMGFTAEQTEQMIEALTNSAIRNRNANYTVSEAVRVASEGYRQELSTLSDSAGVTENLSVMLDNYAKSIGKTASKLTEAEKNQAYLNRTMYAAEPFAGAMADYMDSLAGKQGQYNQAMREAKVAFAEALEPTLAGITTMGTEVLKITTQLIKDHPVLTAGATSFAKTLATVTVALVALSTAKKAYAKATGEATMSTKAFTVALLSNPLTAAAIAISVAIAGLSMLCTAIKENEEATAKLEETTKRYNEIKNGTFVYTDENIANLEKDKAAIEEQIKLMEKQIDLQQKIQENNNGNSNASGLTSVSAQNAAMSRITQGNVKQINKMQESTKEATDTINEYRKELNKTNDELKQNIKTNGKYGNSIDELKEKQEENTKALGKANAIKNTAKAFDTGIIRQQQQEAAQLKINANQMQEYLDIVKKGDKTTTGYQNAVSALAKAYPEAVSASGPLIPVLEGIISAEQLQADEAWNASQTSIEGHIKNVQEAINDENVQKQVAENMGIAWDESFGDKLRTVLALLQTIGGYKPEEVPNIPISTPKRTTSSSGSKSYSNKALDNYKKEIEHKKALDQLSLQEEIAMYEKALNNYAKTQDEKWELEEKIYDLRKEAQEKEYSDYNAFVEHKKAIGKKSLEEEINDYEWAYKNLAKTAEQKQELEEKLYDLRNELQEKNLNDYVSEIQYKKSMDKISLKQEIEMYEKALKDYAKSSEQKKEIRQTLYELNKELAQKEKTLLDQETEDYELNMQKKKELKGAAYDINEQTKDYDKIIKMHKKYLDKVMEDERLSLEERKQIYKEEQAIIRENEKKKRDLRVENIDNTVSQLTNAITKQLEEMQEKDKELIDKNLKAVEEWKNARIDAINEEYDARIEAINKELEALNKAEQQKTRDEEDAEYERKKKRLEELVAFEHDAVTKANYQKELDKLIEEYQKTLDKRALDDKKEELNAQKELLKEEQDSKVQAVEDETKDKKEMYDKQLKKIEAYYDKQIDKAQETAEKMLLNVDKNQDDILKLLKKYGNKYEITGQTLGEKLAQGINEGLADKIEKAIGKFQDTIDKNIEKKIKEWTASNYKYEPKANKPKVETINVTQINNIEQNPEMPSETYRKLNNVSQKLATEIAGM